MGEYIIINKTAIQKRIEELKATDTASWEYQLGQINTLNEVLSQSTPLIPEIEKAFDEGVKLKWEGILIKKSELEQQKQDYISNLKLDI